MNDVITIVAHHVTAIAIFVIKIQSYVIPALFRVSNLTLILQLTAHVSNNDVPHISASTNHRHKVVTGG